MRSHQSEELILIDQLLTDIPANLPYDARAEEEAVVIEFVGEMEDKEARWLAINALASRVKTRSEAFDDLVYGSRPLMEIPAAELPRLGERLLEGKNAAIVVRANTYTDFDQDVLRPLWELRRFGSIEQEEFPRPANVSGHSGIHLDYFDEGVSSHFPYDLSLSRTESGSVLFVAGLASKAVYGWNEAQYQQARNAINNSNRILGLKERATDQTSPRGVSYSEWHPKGRGVQDLFIATTLSEGDVVAWPQGGPQAELPAWHGFLQIGHPDNAHFIPRKSTSYHMSGPSIS